MQPGENRTLADVIADLDSIDKESVIYVTSPHEWAEETPAVLLNLPDGQYHTQIGGLTYFLEVRLAQHVIDVWREWHHGQLPSAQEKIAAVIHYAVNDSYQPP